MTVMSFRVPGAALLLFLGTALGIATPAAAIKHRLGLGVHQWRPASPQDRDESDLTALVSYQLVLFRPLKLQADLEFFPNGFGGSGEEAWYPQGSIVVGVSTRPSEPAASTPKPWKATSQT